MGANLTKGRRLKLMGEAWHLSGEGKTHLEIAKALGINKNTVAALLAEEHERRREILPDEDLVAMATYERIIREVFERLPRFAPESSATNVVGLLNAALGAQNGKNRVTGAEKPKEFRGEFKHTDERIDLSKASEELLSGLEEFLAENEAQP
jgi:hypothetical protein